MVSTMKRPVPLEHYILAKGKMFKLMDAKGKFLSDQLKEAIKDDKAEREKEKASRLFVADDCPTGSGDGLTRPLQALTYNQFVDWCAPWPGQADA